MRAGAQDVSGSVREVPDGRAQERPAEGDHGQRTQQAIPDRDVAVAAKDSADDEEQDRRRGREIDHRSESGPSQTTKRGLGVAELAVADAVLAAVHQMESYRAAAKQAAHQGTGEGRESRLAGGRGRRGVGGVVGRGGREDPGRRCLTPSITGGRSISS